MKTHRISVDESFCDEARRLLARGEAQPEDRLEAYRGEQLCLFGIVGEAAKWQLFGVRYVKYKPKEGKDDITDLRDECFGENDSDS